MRKKLCKCVLAFVSMLCILCTPVTPIYAEPQGTDGTELQVMEPEQLEIQLGAGWAGVEFQLKTDAGLYPGTIAVGEDGVLRLEIGGSKSYVLTCMNSTTAAPETAQAPATSEETQNEDVQETANPGEQANDAQTSDGDSESMAEHPEDGEASDVPEETEGTVAGIPVVHIVLFAGGMVLAVGSLIAMRVMKRRRESDVDYDDEDEDE